MRNAVEEHVVAEGSYQGGVSWRMVAQRQSRDELLVMTKITGPDGRTLSSGGSGGPALAAGRALNVSSGGRDEGPYRIDVRVPPEVARVTVTAADGTVLEMPLYDCAAIPGVRFGLLLVPRDLRLAYVAAFKASGREADRFDLAFHQEMWHRHRDR
jgi:hypothetical protein